MVSITVRLFATLLLTLASIQAVAENRYISDELRVPLRKSPCSSCAIIHRGLVAGTKLTLHETENDWARVTTGSGLTGWVPLQYLVSKPVAKDRLTAAETNTKILLGENESMKEELETLRKDFDELEKQYAKLEHYSGDLETELSTIKKVSANAIALQEQNEELIKQNRMLQSEVDVLTATRDQLSSDNSRKWFLYGGLAVFLGAILAVLLPQLRPRKRFTEWAP